MGERFGNNSFYFRPFVDSLRKRGEIRFVKVSTRFFNMLAIYSQESCSFPFQACNKKELPKELKRIVVVSTTAIGDTLLSTPVFEALRQEFKQAKIKVFMQKKFIPLFAENPHVDGFVPFQKGFFSSMKTIGLLRREKFELALALHVSDPLPIYMTVIAKIPFLIGYSPDRSVERFFTQIVEPPVGRHCIFNRLAVLESLSAHRPQRSHRLVLSVPEERRREILGRYKKYGLPDPDKNTLIGFQPGASKQFKMWPVESFIELGKELIARNQKAFIAILGSRGERKLGDRIARGIGEKDRVVSLCGLIPIGELPTIVSSLKTLVTNDTGTMHIAIALKVPTVSLFVPTSHEGIGPIQDREIHRVVWRPRPCGADCVTKKCKIVPACMSLIPIGEVLEATLSSLES